MTLDSYFSRFIKEKATAGLQKTSVTKYKKTYDLHISPYLGKTQLRLIDRDTVLEVMTGEWENLGPGARKAAVKLLKTILNSAYTAGLIQQNPAQTVKTPKTVTAVRKDDERLIEERTDVLKIVLDYTRQRAINNRPENIQIYGLFMLLALGLRRSEVLGLTRSAIKVDERVSLYIDTQLTQETGKGFSLKTGTKNRRHRQIFLPDVWDDAVSDLDDVARQIQEKFPSQKKQWWNDLLFRDIKTGKCWTYRRFSDVFHQTMRDALLKNGYDETDIRKLEFRPHYVRHISSSLMIKMGTPLSSVQDVLGHLDSSMTQYYTHVGSELRRQATEGLKVIAPKEPTRKKNSKPLVTRGKKTE